MKRRDVLSLLGGATLTSALAASPIDAKAADRKTIYMITFRGQTDVERGFKEYLKQTSLNYQLIERDVNKDIKNIAPFLDEIRQIKPDLIYTWGSPVTLAVVGSIDEPTQPIGDIPVVFALVATPLQSRIVKTLALPGRNVTGATHVVPTETQIRAITTYRPFKKIGMIYNEDEPSSVVIRDEIRTHCNANGADLIALNFRKDAAGRPIGDDLASMVKDIKRAGAEWLHVPADTFLGTLYPKLISALIEEKLPSFGAVELAVRQGAALFGLISRYYYVGQLAALKAVQILTEGKDPGAIPVESLKRFSLIVNMKLARELEFYPPLSLLTFAEIIEV
jgi:putative tryptophan/tyrosine transport system substrate-binding protein